VSKKIKAKLLKEIKSTSNFYRKQAEIQAIAQNTEQILKAAKSATHLKRQKHKFIENKRNEVENRTLTGNAMNVNNISNQSKLDIKTENDKILE
jgi:hypothetical protein